MRRAGWGRASSAALLGLCAMAATLEPARAAAETVVSITFDDTNENQWRAGALLRAHGMNATFYVNSSRVGVPGFLGLDQLLTLQAEGDEIGSHTLSHANLTLLETAAQRVEVCDDRTALLAMGFAVSSFAYPFGGDDASAKQVLAECGFGSARDISGIRSPFGCFNCPYAETLPPGDPYQVRSTPSVRLSTTLEVLKGYVVQAEQHGGGWVPIVLHHVCDGCNEYAISEATLEAFLAWLEPREAQGTVVRTVAEVMGSGSPPLPPPEPGPNLLKSPSLELDSDGNGTPDCWLRGGYGTNTFAWSRTADAHSGSSAQRVTISSLDSGDRKLVSAQDSGACAPLARAGHSYRVSAWYKADAPTRLVAYYRAGDGRWVWWAQSPRYPVTGTYAQVSWETPPFPEGATFISVGYSLLAPGSMTVDDLSLSDTAAGPVDVTAPQVALLRPSDGGVVQGQATFEAQASDETAMGSVDFLVDGRVVGSATSSTGLYAITWDSTSVANGPVAIAALATDAAGNVAVSTSRTVLVANEVAEPGPNLLKNPSLELDSDRNGTPDCWQRAGYGTNTFAWSRSADAHSGGWAEQVIISSLESGDRKLVSAQDSGSCAPLGRAGHTYQVSAWFKADAPTRLVAYYRTADGKWVWWAQSPRYPATASWSQVSWEPPPFPEGATFISVGHSLLAPGTLRVDDLALIDTAAGPVDAIAPQVALLRPSAGEAVQGQVTFEAQASDETAMGSVDFLVDGRVVGSATSSSGSFAIVWDSTSVANGPVAIAAMATDAAGNATLSESRTVLVANDVAEPGPNLLKNASLELDSDGNGTPDCWQRGGYGTNAFTWTRTADAHSGSWAQRVSVTSLDSGDRKLVSAQDAGACAPFGRAGHTYLATAWYKADAPTRFAAYYRTADGRWVWWAQSERFPATGTYAQVSWETPPFPEGATAISIGYSLLAAGSMTVDDLSLSDTAEVP